MKNQAAKKDDHNGIDEISQTCLEDEATGHGVDKRPPVEGNEQAGTGYIRPLLPLMAKPCQIGQEMLVHDQDKAKDGGPDDA